MSLINLDNEEERYRHKMELSLEKERLKRNLMRIEEVEFGILKGLTTIENKYLVLNNWKMIK
jgi:hypothetical protein